MTLSFKKRRNWMKTLMINDTQTVERYHSLFDDMISRINKEISLNAAILFGSRARGDARKTSDYDIILIGDFQERFIDRGKIISHLLPSMAIDIFCYTPSEFEMMFSSFNLTAIDGIGEGIVLFGQKFLSSYQERFEEFIQKGMKKYKCVLIPPST